MNAGFAVFGVLSGAVGLMAPRPATEGESGFLYRSMKGLVTEVAAIRQDLKAINRAFGNGRPALVSTKLAEFWGEPGCLVTYHFIVRDRFVRVYRSRRAQGVPPYRWSFTNVGTSDSPTATGMRMSTMQAVETEGFFPGQAVQFIYRTDGAVERLDWHGEHREQPELTLVRCPREAS